MTATSRFILVPTAVTDFVVKRCWLPCIAYRVPDAAAGKITDVEVPKAQFEEERVALSRKSARTSTFVASFPAEGGSQFHQHGARIGVLVAAGADEELVKQLAMHVAASKPEFVAGKTFA